MHLNHWAKHFSRILLGVAVTTVLATTTFSAQAQSRYPITSEQKNIAEQTAEVGVALSELADNAPDKHTVVPGDTLWGISSKFLKSPWRWPQLWGMNKAEIQNPHLIYPGQTLYLVRDGDRARLQIGSGSGSPVANDTVKLSPTVRGESTAAKSIPAIPNNVIEPFLSQPLIMEEKAIDNAPRIIAAQENRVYMGSGDIAYVRGLTDDQTTDYFLFRPATPLRDPDTRKILAYEAFFLGTAKLVRRGDPATFTIVNAKSEVGMGDRLVKVEKPAFINYVPRAPEKDLRGRVVSIYGGVRQAATSQVVSISVGRNQGVEIGDVLALYRKGEKVVDRTNKNRKELVKLPDEAYGVLFVFRTFEKLSYGLIMNVRLPVEVGDTVQKP